MPHASPSTMLLWSVLCVIEMSFLLVHLWRYDRFNCLKWNSGRQPGAFKRVMTYSYLLSIPLIAVYTTSMAVIKYREGYIDLTKLGYGVRPVPHEIWPKKYQAWILPSTVCFSIAWSLEIVSHLEELTFWLFLLHQGATQRNWFSSIEFKAWLVGSVTAVAGMPTITVLMRNNADRMEAWTFFAGSVGSLLVTLWFLVVLFKFPRFLRRVRAEGADAEVVVRLTTFDELNRVRVGFRFLFTIPLLVLAIDGLLPGLHPVNRSLFWADLLAMLGGIGCIVSSLLTLLIFFPRSIAKEAGYRAKTISINSKQTGMVSTPSGTYHDGMHHSNLPSPSHGDPAFHPHRTPTPNSTMALNRSYQHGAHGGVGSGPTAWEMTEVRHPGDIEAYGNSDPRNYLKVESQSHLPGEEEPKHPSVRVTKPKPVRPPRPSTPPLHPLILNYTSPIDLMDQQRPRPPRRL